MKSIFLSCILVILLFDATIGSKKPGLVLEEKPVALMNGTAHLGNGDTIENAIITFANGEITLVADARLVRVDLSAYEVINIYGKHVYQLTTCTKEKKEKCFTLVENRQKRQLTENQMANLAILEHEISQPENKLVYMFEEGCSQSVNAFDLSEDQIKKSGVYPDRK